MMERSEDKLRLIANRWKMKAKDAIERAKMYRVRLYQMESNYNELKELSKDWSEAYNGILAIMERFNKLPWYKKMFYKFNV